MKLMSCSVLVASALVIASGALDRPAQQAPSTPPELVATYNSLADAILAVKKTEHDFVVAMLTGTFRHGEVKLNQAVAKMAAGQPAKEEIEALAALVSQMGNEGDNSVAAIRKKLLDGGFHHNAAGEAQGVFDEGFVIVTKEAKKSFLASAAAIAKMSAGGSADALKAEWANVKTTWGKLSAAK